LGYLGTVDLRWLDDHIVSSTPTAKVVQFYDIIGAVLMNDWYHYLFEERAMDMMIAECGFASGQWVVEVGPGSGFLADRILRKITSAQREEGGEGPSVFSYVGVDMSQTMHDKSNARLTPYIRDGVARLHLVNDTFDFLASDLADGSVDRFIFTYVLDLLPPDVIRGFAHILPAKMSTSIHSPAKVCIVNLTYGFDSLSRLVTNVWQMLYYMLGGGLVGGCRPIHILDYFHSSSSSSSSSDISYHYELEYLA
jgi:hypothetical protein